MQCKGLEIKDYEFDENIPDKMKTINLSKRKCDLNKYFCTVMIINIK